MSNKSSNGQQFLSLAIVCLSGGLFAGPAEGLYNFHANLIVFDVLSSVVLAI